ncbi:hypothetical protein [Paracraurococcus lichenis]|uniref:Uncharacterized protein n=1 Tax=Paracraurococcus lichenis TaxID=3064888 RepID=A0ABT9E3A8_9PROT|nr:hypothetical protein [Paracraurococcus sp. LOR1-02]MDO9710641.1 hypothetical protein [Paracraurococcus sp. LOR1-02]
MRVVDQIPKMEPAALAALRANAMRWIEQGTDRQKREAETILLAIEVEERCRVRAKSEAELGRKAAIAERTRNRGLHDRVVEACRARPLAAWEVEVLRAIAADPGRDSDSLAEAINKGGGGYINLAVGSLCSEREPWLGTAPPAEDGSAPKVYSALLIDFTRHEDASGRVWHGWTLKPAAETALRQLGIL